MASIIRHGLRSVSRTTFSRFQSRASHFRFSVPTLSRGFTSRGSDESGEVDESVPKDLKEAREHLIDTIENEDLPELEVDSRERACQEWLEQRKAQQTFNENERRVNVSYKTDEYSVDIDFSREIDEWDEGEEEEEEEEGQGDEDSQQEEQEEDDSEEYQGGPQQVFNVTLAPLTKQNAKLKYSCHASKHGALVIDHLELSQKDGSFAPEEKAEVVWFEELKAPTKEYIHDILRFSGIDDETAMFVQSSAELERQKGFARQLKKLSKWLQL